MTGHRCVTSRHPARIGLRDLPSIDALAAELDAPHPVAVRVAREVVAERRAELLDGAEGEADLVARARARVAAADRPLLRRVLNATGVLLHTNLGRAPLADSAREAVARAAEGYANLELSLVSGERGSRHDHVEGLLRELTGAEAAMAVNNCAGAALLAVAALAGGGREVVVSRGQLVEIGGGFRIPEVVAQAGARLVEVGTTNRTRLDDYAGAVGDETGAILRCHPSNFRQLGFVEDVGVEALCGLGVPVVDDVGSGVLAAGHPLLAEEPDVRASVAAGAALVCVSGDKLLGGPQAGLIVGTADAIALARAHPLARALRIDKLSLAALEATLRLHRDPERARAEIPVLAMLDAEPEVLRARAERLAALCSGAPEAGAGNGGALGERGSGVAVVDGVARVGGGALPLLELPGPVVALAPADGDADGLAARLRAGDPPLVGRIERGRFLLDPRTLLGDEEVEAAGAAVRAAR